MRTIKYLLLFSSLLGTSFLLAEEPQAALIVFKDDEVYRALPKRFLFPDIEDALFRSSDGKKLHLGPGRDGVFFELSPDGSTKVHKAPSAGKAYLDKNGEFAIWYDSLEEGISFKGGEKLKLHKPVNARFGVSYDAGYFYLTQTNTTRIFTTEEIHHPILEIPGFYNYKLVAHEDEIHLFGYAYLGHEEMRTHQYRRYLKVEGEYLLMNEDEMPDHLVLLDLNPFERRALFLNDSKMVPQLFQMNMENGVIKSLGMVQYYGLFLHPDFRKLMPSSHLPSE